MSEGGRCAEEASARPGAPRMLHGTVVAREPLGGEVVLVTVRVPGERVDLAPGQFVQAHAFAGFDPLLPRPLAPFDVRAADGGDGTAIELMIAATGRGTRILAGLEPGRALRLLGPLGRGFTVPARAAGEGASRGAAEGARGPIVGVAGGVGLAPLHHLARVLRDAGRGEEVEVILGARSADRLHGRGRLEALGVRVTLATDAGDAGFAGHAVAALAARLDAGLAPAIVHGCGPEPMLRALAVLARDRALRCEVSLERRMACGFGVCFTCVAPLADADGRPRHVRTCLEGPVVDAARWRE